MDPRFSPYVGDEPFIFVCYAHTDTNLVVPEMAWLHEQGAKLWYDQGLSAGEIWRDELADAIERSAALLYFATPRSVMSENCLREIDLALSLQRTIITVMLAGTVLTPRLLFRIGNVQVIQAEESGLPSVRGQVASAIDAGLIRQPLPATAPLPGNPPTRVPSRQPGRHIRITVGIDATETSQSLAADLAASVAHYISWVGGAYRAIGPADARAIAGENGDYNAVLHISSSTQRIRMSWEVIHQTSGEMADSARHVESPEDFLTRSEQVADMVAESIVGFIDRHRLEQALLSPSDKLSYWDLLLQSTLFTGMSQDRIEARINLVRRALELEPDRPHAHSALADILSWRVMNDVSPDADADRALAVASIDTAVHVARNDASVLMTSGTALCRLGEYDRGLALCERAGKLAPSMSTKGNLAMSLCFSGKPDQAIQLFEEIRSITPAGRTFPYGRLAVALTQMGRIDEALAMADLCVGNAPKDYYGWVVRANLLAIEGRLIEAQQDIDRARELFSRDLDIARLADGADRAYGRTEAQRRWVSGGLRALS